MERFRKMAAVLAMAFALAGVAACGGDDEAEASVGACINDANEVVDCSSDEAAFELVSDQDAPDAIACVVIDDPPQEEVEVDGGNYCAEPLE